MLTTKAYLVMLLACKDDSIARLISYTTEVKPGLKAGQVSKDVREQEVEQTPKFTQVVLQRSTCNAVRCKPKNSLTDLYAVCCACYRWVKYCKTYRLSYVRQSTIRHDLLIVLLTAQHSSQPQQKADAVHRYSGAFPSK